MSNKSYTSIIDFKQLFLLTSLTNDKEWFISEHFTEINCFCKINKTLNAEQFWWVESFRLQHL